MKEVKATLSVAIITIIGIGAILVVPFTIDDHPWEVLAILAVLAVFNKIFKQNVFLDFSLVVGLKALAGLMMIVGVYKIITNNNVGVVMIIEGLSIFPLRKMRELELFK